MAGEDEDNIFRKSHSFEGLFGPVESEIPRDEKVIEETDVSVPDNTNTEDKNEKYKLHHSVKFTEEEEEMFQQILSALNTTVDSKVIKWCLIEAYSMNEDKIKRINKKKRHIETL